MACSGKSCKHNSVNKMQSKKPSKQRNQKANAPLHLRGKMLRTNVSEEIEKKYLKTAVRVIKGDKIKIVKGQHEGKTGKVEKVFTKKMKLQISELTISKRDGTKVPYLINPNKVIITELNLEDKKRQEILKRK